MKAAWASGVLLKPRTFKVDDYRRQLIGVTTEEVTCINMTKIIHASAQISYDQTRLIQYFRFLTHLIHIPLRQL